MGKPRALSKKAKKLAKKKGLEISGNTVKNDACSPTDDKTEQANTSKYTIEQILDKASDFIDMYNYEMAQKFCQRALEIDNDNVRALETTATLLLEAGDAESAKQCLGRAITVAPSTGHTKYLSLSQLMEGKESLQLYNKAIEIIINAQQNKVQSNKDTNPDEHKENISNIPTLEAIPDTLTRELSNAYCAVAELWMTDLCDENDAEMECSSSIANAVEADPSNPEAWQTKARFHLIKSEFEDARFSIRESLSKWLPSYTEALESRPSSSGKKFDPVEVCTLLYTTRIATSKILIELEEWDSATKVLDGLIEEDEDVVDTWYLLGWLNKLRADFEREPNNPTKSIDKSKDESSSLNKLPPKEDDVAEGYIGNARFYLKKAISVHRKNPTDDSELISHVQEILIEIGDASDEDQDIEDAEDKNWEEYETDSENEENGMDQG